MSTGEFAKYCVQRVIARAETCFSPSTCFRVIGMSLDAVTGSRADFLRNPETHRRTPNEFFQRAGREDRRFNYLSEWHSHSSFQLDPAPPTWPPPQRLRSPLQFAKRSTAIA
jgi:hypothetical protein